MIVSNYKHYEELPLFLNAKTVAQVLGVSISTAYELFHEPGFPHAARGQPNGGPQGEVHPVGRAAVGR